MYLAVMALFEVAMVLIRPVALTPNILGTIWLVFVNQPLKGYRPRHYAIR